MNIFGFRITRSKEKYSDEELNDLTVFVNIVDSLHLELTTMYDFVSGKSDRQCTLEEFPMVLLHKCETVKSLIRIYSEHRYSSPGRAFTMEQMISNLGNGASRLIDAVLNVKLHDLDEETYSRELTVAAFHMCSCIDTIRIECTYDMVRILIGVDIIRDYHDSKRIPDGISKYNVKISKKHIKKYNK